MIRMLKTIGRRKKGSAYVLSDWKAMAYVRYREAEIIQDLGKFSSSGMKRQQKLIQSRRKLVQMLKEFPELRKESRLKADMIRHLA